MAAKKCLLSISAVCVQYLITKRQSISSIVIPTYDCIAEVICATLKFLNANLAAVRNPFPRFVRLRLQHDLEGLVLQRILITRKRPTCNLRLYSDTPDTRIITRDWNHVRDIGKEIIRFTELLKLTSILL